MKLHVNKVKNGILDQLSNKVCTLLKTVEDKISCQETCIFKDIRDINFSRDSVICKYLVCFNMVELKYYETFTKFIGTYFLLLQSSSSGA